jgi:predicted metal-dependent hydrolase
MLYDKETLGLYRQKQHKPWFYEECSQVLGQKRQAKMQWLQNPNQSNSDNLNNATQEASRHFRNKKREYLKAKINELEINSKNKNIRELYRGAYRALVGKPEGRRPLGRPRRRWEDNIKMDLREVGWGNGLDQSGSG